MKKIRVLIQQPALPKYRVSLFRELGCREDIDFTLLYGKTSNLANAGHDGFRASFIPAFGRRVLNLFVGWHSAHFQCVNPKYSDVAVLCWDIQYISVIPAIIMGRLRKVSVILWGHGYSKNEKFWRRSIRTFVGKRADAVILYNYSAAKHLLETGWDKKSVYVAVNALDQSFISQEQKKWDASKLSQYKKNNSFEDGFNLLYIGRIYPQNRLEILINALSLLVKKFPKIRLTIIGEENEYSKSLRELAETLHVAGHIHWLGSIYSEEELAPLLLSSDVFCFPANLGLSLMHASGYRLPTITSNDMSCHGPEVEVLEDGYNCLLYKHGCHQSMAEKISIILSNSELRANMSAAAHKTIDEHYNVFNMTEGFLKAIYAVQKNNIDSHSVEQ